MKTYNTIVTSKEVEVLANVVARCPYECIELDPGKYGFMDNGNGDIRNYFCETLGYECSNYEAFDFEYFDEPQTVESSEPNFYTPNGWQGAKYDIKKGAKEVAKELRAYIKANPDLNACKWSIRSKWGMCADSLYISLMSAPFDPFSEEYKVKHEYRYNRGYSEHGDIEDYTNPEAYKLIKKVKSFVMQYIHDDSDGMIDYFDRNIYDHYEIGQYDKPFQLIEKKESPKQGEPSKEANEAKASESVVTPEGMEIVDYSEKAIAVFGETKAIKDELKKLGGKFNPALKHNGEKRAGWIFSKKQAEKVRALLALAAEPESIKEGDFIAFKTNSFAESKTYKGFVKYKEQLGFVVIADAEQYELKKLLDIVKIGNTEADALDEMSGTQDSEPVKLYNTSFGIGTAKYVVNFHDGIKRHNDGSRFYDIRIFSNKKEMVKFIKELEKEGYKLDTFFNESESEKEAKKESDRIAFAKASKAFIQEWRANNPYTGSDHLDEFNAKFNRDYSAFADKYGVFSYMVPNPYPVERGEYKEAALDRQKKAADILVESIEGNWYTIRLNREIEIKSKRIRKYDNGCIAVPESMYYKLKDKYNVMCNF